VKVQVFTDDACQTVHRNSTKMSELPIIYKANNCDKL